MFHSLPMHLLRAQPRCKHITQARLVRYSDPEIWRLPGMTSCRRNNQHYSAHPWGREQTLLGSAAWTSAAILVQSLLSPECSASSFLLWTTAHFYNRILTLFIYIFIFSLFVFKLARVYFQNPRILRYTGALSTDNTDRNTLRET